MTSTERQALDRRAEWDRLRAAYLRPRAQRPPSAARGIHHLALLCSDVERTIRFYQDVLGFPLVELFENRDYRGSTHFFHDIGHGNLLAFFDFPDLGLGPYQEVLGGLHHVAISVPAEQWEQIRARLDEAGIAHVGAELGAPSSLYFSDPDGVRLEIIREPLGEMGGRDLGG
ncbi:MAG: VOC family protein [Acidimicrobiales bacterium]